MNTYEIVANLAPEPFSALLHRSIGESNGTKGTRICCMASRFCAAQTAGK
jgi:hypothetical protein